MNWKPYTFVVIFALTAMVVLMFGQGLQDIDTAQNNTGTDQYYTDSPLFANVSHRISGEEGFSGLRDTAVSTIGEEGEEEGADAEESVGLIRRGFRALRSLFLSLTIMEEVADTAGREVGVPWWVIDLLAVVLVVIFAVVIYTWVRNTT